MYVTKIEKTKYTTIYLIKNFINIMSNFRHFVKILLCNLSIFYLKKNYPDDLIKHNSSYLFYLSINIYCVFYSKKNFFNFECFEIL